MKTHELARLLLSFPDVVAEVNDNNGGEVYLVEHVDYFPADMNDPEMVMIQVNCE